MWWCKITQTDVDMFQWLVLPSCLFFCSHTSATSNDNVCCYHWSAAKSHSQKYNLLTKTSTCSEHWLGIASLPFSGVASCDDGSEAGVAETSLFSSLADSPFGGLWKRNKSWNLGTSSKLNQVVEDRLLIQQAVSTHQNSFRHVLPKHKFCPAVCTVCGIFWTKMTWEGERKWVSWGKPIMNGDELLKILKRGHCFITLG